MLHISLQIWVKFILKNFWYILKTLHNFLRGEQIKDSTHKLEFFILLREEREKTTYSFHLGASYLVAWNEECYTKNALWSWHLSLYVVYWTCDGSYVGFLESDVVRSSQNHVDFRNEW